MCSSDLFPSHDKWAQGSLQDYLSWPTVGQVGVGNTVSASALYTRAYNLIYNTWFRDENLQNAVTVDKGDGPDTASNYVLLKRGKAHDYFTSCLPFAQKGVAVPLPLTGNAPVLGIGAKTTAVYTSAGSNFRQSNGTAGTGTDWTLGGTNDLVLNKVLLLVIPVSMLIFLLLLLLR